MLKILGLLRVALSITVGFGSVTALMFAAQTVGFQVWAFFHDGRFLLCVAACSAAIYMSLGRLRWFRRTSNANGSI